ncbi:MAG: hypothetical protein WD824_24980 [Cyclobacteriaceae bacterium]
MSNEKPTFIQFKKGRIDYGFYWIRKQEGDYFSCYIPAYDLYFSCKADVATATKRAANMVRAFLDFWRIKEGNRSFFLKLHSLGFRTHNHNFTLKQLLNNKNIETKFSAEEGNIPDAFEGLEINAEKGELVFS